MLKKYKLLFVVVCLFIISLLTGFFLRGKYQKHEENTLIKNDYPYSLDMTSALIDFIYSKDDYINLFEDGEILQVEPILKKVYGKQIITTLRVNKVYKSDNLNSGDIIQVKDTYDIVKYSDGTFVELPYGLNMPMTDSGEYIVNLVKLYSNKLYDFKTNSFSCFKMSDEPYNKIEIASQNNIYSPQKYNNFIFKFNIDYYSKEEGQTLFGVDNISDYINEMNDIQTNVLSKIQNLK